MCRCCEAGLWLLRCAAEDLGIRRTFGEHCNLSPRVENNLLELHITEEDPRKQRRDQAFIVVRDQGYSVLYVVLDPASILKTRDSPRTREISKLLITTNIAREALLMPPAQVRRLRSVCGAACSPR